MKITKIFEDAFEPSSYWNVQNDNRIRKLKQPRKHMITLRTLNELRRIREVKKLDNLKQETINRAMYSRAGGEETGGF